MDRLKEQIKERLRQMEVGVLAELEYCENPFESRKDELQWVLKTIDSIQESQRTEAWGNLLLSVGEPGLKIRTSSWTTLYGK